MIPQALAAPASTAANDPLSRACASLNPGIACRLVFDFTHNARAAELTRVFFAGPAHLVLRIGWVLLVALVVRAGAHRLIGRFSSRLRQSAESGPDRPRLVFGERRQQRAAAVASILRNAASVTIFSIAFVMILGDLGLDLAPVLASAGVLGVAIGFGAQNLVQDFLAGIFMLLEDQYGVGDVVTISDITGTVEGVSLRITRVRDIDGIVWNIRNGTIQQAGNESYGWARAVVDFPVPYHSDVTRVREQMQDAAAAMWQEPQWRDVIVERPEVWGVQDLSLDQIVLRVIARTSPMRQWAVKRELQERLLRAVGSADVSEMLPSAGEASAGEVASAGAPDAGAPDAGAPDAEAPDAGAPDAEAPDGGAMTGDDEPRAQ